MMMQRKPRLVENMSCGAFNRLNSVPKRRTLATPAGSGKIIPMLLVYFIPYVVNNMI